MTHELSCFDNICADTKQRYGIIALIQQPCDTLLKVVKLTRDGATNKPILFVDCMDTYKLLFCII